MSLPGYIIVEEPSSESWIGRNLFVVKQRQNKESDPEKYGHIDIISAGIKGLAVFTSQAYAFRFAGHLVLPLDPVELSWEECIAIVKQKNGNAIVNANSIKNSIVYPIQ